MSRYFTDGLYDGSDTLEHHGVKGQKWGVRRYQNADGTYTAAGRRRYGENLDINDRSRRNVAKIRLGEARRRLDTAKTNSIEKGTNNNYRIAQLKARERSAKKAVRNARKVDKGAKLAAKGQTVTGNKVKGYITNVALIQGSRLIGNYMASKVPNVRNPKEAAIIGTGANVVHTLGPAIAAVNIARTLSNNSALRAYSHAVSTNSASIKSMGSDEYKTVVERRKKQQE